MKIKPKHPIVISKIIFSDVDFERVNDEIMHRPDYVKSLMIEDSTELAAKIIEIVNEELDKVAPKRKIVIHHDKKILPKMSDELKLEIALRNVLLEDAKYGSCQEGWREFKNQRNKVSKMKALDLKKHQGKR